MYLQPGGQLGTYVPRQAGCYVTRYQGRIRREKVGAPANLGITGAELLVWVEVGVFAQVAIQDADVGKVDIFVVLRDRVFLLEKFNNSDGQIALFCSTSLPLASTR